MANNNLEILANQFISEKRSLGYKYKSEEYPLSNFIAFYNKMSSIDFIDKLDRQLVEKWAVKRQNEKANTQYSRVTVINNFIDYLIRNDYKANRIKLNKCKRETFTPIILSEEEVTTIFRVLDHLPVHIGQNTHIDYPVMYRILYGCGLRVSELIDLKIGDFDRQNRALIIRKPKNLQDKIVPMSFSLFEIVNNYYLRYNIDKEPDLYFFRSKFNKHYSRGTLTHNWVKILKKADIKHDTDRGPRLHDLRHLFCCLSLKKMIESGKDPYVCLPYLATYVGHKSTTSTQKYIHLSQHNYDDILESLDRNIGKVIPNEK